MYEPSCDRKRYFVIYFRSAHADQVLSLFHSGDLSFKLNEIIMTKQYTYSVKCLSLISICHLQLAVWLSAYVSRTSVNQWRLAIRQNLTSNISSQFLLSRGFCQRLHISCKTPRTRHSFLSEKIQTTSVFPKTIHCISIVYLRVSCAKGNILFFTGTDFTASPRKIVFWTILFSGCFSSVRFFQILWCRIGGRSPAKYLLFSHRTVRVCSRFIWLVALYDYFDEFDGFQG